MNFIKYKTTIAHWWIEIYLNHIQKFWIGSNFSMYIVLQAINSKKIDYYTK